MHLSHHASFVIVVMIINLSECVVIQAVFTICTVSSPHAPYNVTVVTSQTSAKLSWQPAYDGGFTHHYVIWCVVFLQTVNFRIRLN
jgi:hypothetical protein